MTTHDLTCRQFISVSKEPAVGIFRTQQVDRNSGTSVCRGDDKSCLFPSTGRVPVWYLECTCRIPVDWVPVCVVPVWYYRVPVRVVPVW